MEREKRPEIEYQPIEFNFGTDIEVLPEEVMHHYIALAEDAGLIGPQQDEAVTETRRFGQRPDNHSS